MEQPEHQHRDARVRLKAEEPFEPVHVVERLVDDREADDGVDEIRVGVDADEHAGQQRHAVPDREQADVQHDVAQAVRKKITPTRNSRWS